MPSSTLAIAMKRCAAEPSMVLAARRRSPAEMSFRIDIIWSPYRRSFRWIFSGWATLATITRLDRSTSQRGYLPSLQLLTQRDIRETAALGATCLSIIKTPRSRDLLPSHSKKALILLAGRTTQHRRPLERQLCFTISAVDQPSAHSNGRFLPSGLPLGKTTEFDEFGLA